MGRIQSIFYISFVFFLLFSVGNTEDKQVINSLVEFMEKLGPPMNLQNTTNWGWNSSSDPCIDKWQGITCDSTNTTVQKITLEQLSLTGTLDFESLCDETSLLLLSLRYNNLTGTLPPEISNCKNLRHLYVTGNHFSGNLPDSITDLSDLKRVDISNNELNGILPDLSRITGLKSFLASNNRFSGELPNFNYHSLDQFNISNNDLSGSIPDDTGNFSSNSFLGNPNLCGKILGRACPVTSGGTSYGPRGAMASLPFLVLVSNIYMFISSRQPFI